MLELLLDRASRITLANSLLDNVAIRPLEIEPAVWRMLLAAELATLRLEDLRAILDVLDVASGAQLLDGLNIPQARQEVAA